MENENSDMDELGLIIMLAVMVVCILSILFNT